MSKLMEKIHLQESSPQFLEDQLGAVESIDPERAVDSWDDSVAQTKNPR